MACNLYKGIDILAPATAPVVSWCGAAYRGGLRALLLCPHSPSAGGAARAGAVCWRCVPRARGSREIEVARVGVRRGDSPLLLSRF
jgi:hypothetical protein